MGGLGSGRRPRQRAVVEACEVLDVNKMNQSLALPPHLSEGDEIRLSFQVCDYDGNWHGVAKTIRIVRVPRRPFGGELPYFICPGHWKIGCGRRCVKLYRGSGFYLCRRCHRLGYASENEDAMDRAMRRAGKIKLRLGGDPDWLAPFPPRPKGMWRKTYERLWCRHWEAELRLDRALARYW
jgi:hypothetical protein